MSASQQCCPHLDPILQSRPIISNILFNLAIPDCASVSSVQAAVRCAKAASCPAGADALTGPGVTWEAPERGGSRMSVVLPGGPEPDQLPAGESPLTSEAESAPAQRTSFSISLDINTNIVSIQGSVISPNQTGRTARSASVLSINQESANCHATQATITEQESDVEKNGTMEGKDAAPEQSAYIGEPLVEDICSPEEETEAGEEADIAELPEEVPNTKQDHVLNKALAPPLDNQEPATGIVAQNKMDGADTAQPADTPASDVDDDGDDFGERGAMDSKEAPGNKEIGAAEGTLTISTTDEHMATTSYAQVEENATKGAQALVEGHAQKHESNDALDKAIEDAIADVQQAVAEHES